MAVAFLAEPEISVFAGFSRGGGEGVSAGGVVAAEDIETTVLDNEIDPNAIRAMLSAMSTSASSQGAGTENLEIMAAFSTVEHALAQAMYQWGH